MLVDRLLLRTHVFDVCILVAKVFLRKRAGCRLRGLVDEVDIGRQPPAILFGQQVVDLFDDRYPSLRD